MVVDHPIGSALSASERPVPRVLVVDDEESVMVTIQGILELDGYAVTATSSGEHAMELISKQHFDVVMTDTMAWCDVVLPAGFKAVKVEGLSPESPEPVDLAVPSSAPGRIQFTFPPFLVYGVARIRLAAAGP